MPDLDRPRGALVGSVEEGGPAAKAGVRSGDVIVAVGKEQIEQYSELSGLIAGMQPGTQTQLTVLRDGRQRTLDIEIGELEDPKSSASDAAGERSGALLGMSLRRLTSEEKRRSGAEGSLVVEHAGGAAAAAGVLVGDVIVGINNRRIDSERELRDAIDASSGTVALLIERDDAKIFVAVPLD